MTEPCDYDSRKAGAEQGCFVGMCEGGNEGTPGRSTPSDRFSTEDHATTFSEAVNNVCTLRRGERPVKGAGPEMVSIRRLVERLNRTD